MGIADVAYYEKDFSRCPSKTFQSLRNYSRPITESWTCGTYPMTIVPVTNAHYGNVLICCLAHVAGFPYSVHHVSFFTAIVLVKYAALAVMSSFQPMFITDECLGSYSSMNIELCSGIPSLFISTKRYVHFIFEI